MAEPRLEDIEDYDELKGSKKKIVWRVIVAGILISVGYLVAYSVFTDKGDVIKVQESMNKHIPMR